MNQVIETMTTRRSVRSYKPDMPDQDVLDEILKAGMFFVKYFSLKKASEFPFFSKGFSLPSAGIMHPCA